MLLFLYRYFCGYLYVRVVSDRGEKLLNLCAANGITIWRVNLKGDRLYFKIGINSFKKLRIFKRNVPCKIHITKKYGFPFFANKNKRRYGMVAGLIVFCLLINFLSGRIWNVCISANTEAERKELMQSITALGISEGMAAEGLDAEQKRNELLLKNNKLSWAAINIEGCKLTVDVTNAFKREEKDNTPSNLVAAEDGVIKKIMVKSGVAKVKVGQAVTKGQLLVSGINEYDDGSSYLNRSQGSILAEVGYSIRVEQPFKVTERVRNGECISRRILRFYGLAVPLYLGGVSGQYDLVEPAFEVSAGETYIPVGIQEFRFYKTEEKTYILDEKAATLSAQRSMENRLAELSEAGEIISKNVKTETTDKGVLLTAEIKCVKDIIFEEKILLDTSN